MAYNVKCKRNDDGSYTLSYGKGKKKLTGHLIHHEGGRWYVDKMPGNPSQWNGDTKLEAVNAWGTWAAAAYGGTVPDVSSASDHGPTPPLPSSPPRRKRAKDQDELGDNDRAFFATLSTKTGELTEWQRAQARSMLRQIGWPGRDTSRHPITPEEDVKQAEKDRRLIAEANQPAVHPEESGGTAGTGTPQQAPVPDNHATENPAIPPVPRRPRPDTGVPQ